MNNSVTRTSPVIAFVSLARTSFACKMSWRSTGATVIRFSFGWQRCACADASGLAVVAYGFLSTPSDDTLSAARTGQNTREGAASSRHTHGLCEMVDH
jgi:hypothetical protein